MIFQNREQAGEALAELLYTDMKESNAVVVALPRGGVPVAARIARRLGSKLDILIAHKLGAPYNPEFALGAVTEDGGVWMNQDALEMIPHETSQLEASLETAFTEMRKQGKLFRGNELKVDVKAKTVILVDDGLATGSTLVAATNALKKQGASKIVVAVPVASQKGMKLLKPLSDRVYAVEQPTRFRAIADWYEDFDPVNDADVVRMISESRNSKTKRYVRRREAVLNLDGTEVLGELSTPDRCKGWVVFAHGSGTSLKNTRNIQIAKELNENGFGTLLCDLLTEREGVYSKNRFDVGLLSNRLVAATHWLKWQAEWNSLPIGYFGVGMGAAAALQASLEFRDWMFAIVSRGGQPELSKKTLERIATPTLLIAGEEDADALALNRQAYENIPYALLETIPHATHHFEEPGAFGGVTRMTIDWFRDCLGRYRRGRNEAA